MSALALPASSFAPFGTSEGASFDARKTEYVTRSLIREVRVEPASALSPVMGELLTLAREEAIAAGALPRAMEFASLLPPDLRQLPEVSIDPDGEVAFDWGNEEGMVSVSIGPTGRIVYAAELGGAPTSGTEQLSGGLPEALRTCLVSFRSRR